MKTLKSLIEETKTVKQMKVGKSKNIVASIIKNKNKYDAIVDGDKLDTYTSVQEAEKAINDIIKLLGK
jgi:hypothetical protein